MKTFLGLALGFFLSALLVIAFNESPIHVFKLLFQSVFASGEDLSITLFYTTSLIFAGLAVAVPLKAGLFNIGAEGQLIFASFAAIVTALKLESMSFSFASVVILSITSAMLAGALWGGLVGWLKAWRGAHEVVVTMMMNFIAIGLTTYWTTDFFQSTSSQNPQTNTAQSFLWLQHHDWLKSLSPFSPINFSFFVALLTCGLIAYFLNFNRTGFEMRVSGLSPLAAFRNGWQPQRAVFLSMLIGGMCAGLVALNDVIGANGQFIVGFSPDYGFIGIGVALLVGGRPLLIPFAAFFFAFIHKGTLNLNLDTEYLNRDFGKLMQAIFILSLISFNAPVNLFGRKKKGD